MKQLAGDRRGAISLEVGFLALPLAMLLFGAFKLGLTLKTRAALQYGAELGARWSRPRHVAPRAKSRPMWRRS